MSSGVETSLSISETIQRFLDFARNDKWTALRECASAFFLGFQKPSVALRRESLASIAVRRRRVRSNTRVLFSLRIPGPVQLRIPSRFDFGNHACDTR